MVKVRVAESIVEVCAVETIVVVIIVVEVIVRNSYVSRSSPQLQCVRGTIRLAEGYLPPRSGRIP